MISDIKNTLRQSAVYGLSRISFKLIAFILFPIYSLHFSVDEYGIIVRGEIFWQLLQTFMLFAVETAIIRWYSSISDINKKGSLIFSVFAFLILLNVIFLSVTFYIPEILSNILFSSSIYAVIVKLCLLTAVFETLIGIPLVLLRIQEKAFTYVIIVAVESLISLVLQIYYITSTSQKLEGVFLAKVIAASIVFTLMLPYLVRNIKLKFDFVLLKEVLVFCFPLMLASLVSTLFNSQNRFILGYLENSREVGLFGLGNNIAGILTFLLISPFALAFPPIFWKKIKDPNAQRFYTKSMTYSYFAFVYGAFGLSLAGPNFIKIFALNPDYWLAKDIIPIISFSLAFYGMQVIGFMSFYHHKKTLIVLLILVICTIINLILNLLLIPYLRMYGASIATFVSYLISVFLIYFFSKKYYFIKWENYKLFISMSLAIIMVVPFYIFAIDNLVLTIVLKILSLIIYPILLYFLKFYEPVEIETIKKTIYRYVRK